MSSAQPSFTQLTFQAGDLSYPSVSPEGQSFVFARDSDGDLDIHLQRVGGANPINLTADSPADDSEPAFSPDGSQIAFRSARDGGGVFLMGATGESVQTPDGRGLQPRLVSGRDARSSTAPSPSSRSIPTRGAASACCGR